MRVLCRKVEERIIINENITITIVDIRGDKIRVGIDAPAEVAVHREEVAELIDAKKPDSE